MNPNNPIVAFFTSSRAKSFYWRTAMMVAAGFVSFILAGITSGQLALPAWATVGLGLILGEVSKYLNSQISA